MSWADALPFYPSPNPRGQGAPRNASSGLKKKKRVNSSPYISVRITEGIYVTTYLESLGEGVLGVFGGLSNIFWLIF